MWWINLRKKKKKKESLPPTALSDSFYNQDGMCLLRGTN